MDCQALLEQQARDQGRTLTPLAQMNRFAHSLKIPCCGGVVVRVETESSADSTVCLRDDSGTCFCALHGELTSRYPDVLSAGALLCLADVTLLVTSSKMPPLLVACLENLAGLMLPDEDAGDDPGASTRTSDGTTGPRTGRQTEYITNTGALAVGVEASGVESGPALGESLDVFFPQDGVALPPATPPSMPTTARDGLGSVHPQVQRTNAFASSQSQQAPQVPQQPHLQSRPQSQRPIPDVPVVSSQTNVSSTSAPVKAEVISDDDEDCLELADDL